jgi:hypothetical protein
MDLERDWIALTGCEFIRRNAIGADPLDLPRRLQGESRIASAGDPYRARGVIASGAAHGLPELKLAVFGALTDEVRHRMRSYTAPVPTVALTGRVTIERWTVSEPLQAANGFRLANVFAAPRAVVGRPGGPRAWGPWQRIIAYAEADMGAMATLIPHPAHAGLAVLALRGELLASGAVQLRASGERDIPEWVVRRAFG